MKPTSISRLSIGMYVVLSMCACHPSIRGMKEEPRVSLPDGKDMSNADDERIARTVKDVVLDYCRQGRDAIPAEEAIAAMAAVVGERCIDVAGEYSVRDHEFVPGQRVFSDKINVLLAGEINTDDIAEISEDSVFGTIRDQLAGSRFQHDHFPRLTEIFRNFAVRIGRPEDWGRVPLSLPKEDWPEELPLRVAFDTRPSIDAAVQAIKDDKARILRTCTLAMAMMLKDTDLTKSLEPVFALTLALETINGMAKTAPMTDKLIDDPTQAMREAQHNVIKIGAR